MRIIKALVVLFSALSLSVAALSAQTPAHDPSARLREVLPADVAERVLAVIARARARELPAAALENRALKFAAKGVEPKEIERSVAEQADRMEKAKTALERSRGNRKAAGDEVEAGAEAIRRGVDGSKVSELARSAPSGRSLAVPLFVIGSLVDRGLPSDDALQRVLARLQARASDAELEQMPRELPAQAQGQTRRVGPTGEIPPTSNRPGTAGTPPATRPATRPASVPGNPGTRARPTPPAPPVPPPAKRP